MHAGANRANAESTYIEINIKKRLTIKNLEQRQQQFHLKTKLKLDSKHLYKNI